MQGRLSQQLGQKIQEFPIEFWKEEFIAARDVGFDSIEWVFDSINNPILRDDVLIEIIKVSSKNNISINSIIADFFMEHSLIKESNSEENFKILKKLIENAHKLKIKIIEIPFVDSSSLKSYEDIENLEEKIRKIIPFLERYNIMIVLETDLDPSSFAQLLDRINHRLVQANYDSGNSASLGYVPKEEFDYLGKSIKNVHIKDRLLNSGTVPLGSGNVDFDLLFKLLKKIEYDGDLIIQGARKTNISPKDTCKEYFYFVKQYVDKYLN